MINDKSDNIIAHSEEPGIRHLRAIGRLIVTFNKLDDYVVGLISMLLGTEPELGGIIANSWQGRERFEALQNIFAYRLGFAHKIRSGIDMKKNQKSLQLDELFKAMYKANDIRNQVVHSNWSASFTDKTKAHRLKWKRRTFPGWSDFDYELEDLSNIESEIKFIKKVSEDLGKFVSENFRDYLRQLAKHLATTNSKIRDNA